MAGPVANGASMAIEALHAAAARLGAVWAELGGAEHRHRCERHHPQRAEKQTTYLHVVSPPWLCEKLVVNVTVDAACGASAVYAGVPSG